jgi:hypothetical protein
LTECGTREIRKRRAEPAAVAAAGFCFYFDFVSAFISEQTMRTIGEEHIAGNNTVKQLTLPTAPPSAVAAHIVADGGNVRYSFNDAVTPSSSVGTLLSDGKERYLWDWLAALDVYIPTGCTLHVTYVHY